MLVEFLVKGNRCSSLAPEPDFQESSVCPGEGRITVVLLWRIILGNTKYQHEVRCTIDQYGSFRSLWWALRSYASSSFANAITVVETPERVPRLDRATPAEGSIFGIPGTDSRHLAWSSSDQTGQQWLCRFCRWYRRVWHSCIGVWLVIISHQDSTSSRSRTKEPRRQRPSETYFRPFFTRTNSWARATLTRGDEGGDNLHRRTEMLWHKLCTKSTLKALRWVYAVE